MLKRNATEKSVRKPNAAAKRVARASPRRHFTKNGDGLQELRSASSAFFPVSLDAAAQIFYNTAPVFDRRRRRLDVGIGRLIFKFLNR